MKLIDAIRLVKRPEIESIWGDNASISEIAQEVGVYGLDDWPEELDGRFKSYPIAAWLCTDTHVGLYAIWLDGQPVGCSMQRARKCDTDYKFISQEHAARVREVLMSYMACGVVETIDPDEDIGEDYGVAYVSQSLTEHGMYKGRPVKALVWYDGIGIRNTPPQYRHEGRAYITAVPYQDKNSNCVLVQDGDEERVIPIEEFRIPLTVVPA